MGWHLQIWFVHGLELVYKLGKHQYCCLSIHFYVYVCMFNLYWFSWNMNLEVYMVHWMTFVNCFGTIYTLIPCTVLLTCVHTLILFVAFSAISFVLLGLMFHWNFFLVLCISVFARTANYFCSMFFCKLIVYFLYAYCLEYCL